MTRLRVGVFKLTSCSGCLNELVYVLAKHPQLLSRLDILYFTEVQDRAELADMDLAIVEGSIVNSVQEKLVKRIRELAKKVVLLGTCALFGGVQSLRAGYSVDEVKRAVYSNPEHIDVYGDVKPVADLIEADVAVRGCPVDGDHLARMLKSLVVGGSTPVEVYEVVCSECKLKGVSCVAVVNKVPCLGPITAAGCGALCPSFGRGCYGCYGVAEKHVNREKILKFAEKLGELGMSLEDFKSLLKAYSYKFYKEVFGGQR